MGAMGNAFKISIGKPKGEPRHRWEDNIRTDLRGIEWEGVDLIHLALGRGK
jgi:hypothetical protein